MPFAGGLHPLHDGPAYGLVIELLFTSGWRLLYPRVVSYCLGMNLTYFSPSYDLLVVIERLFTD